MNKYHVYYGYFHPTWHFPLFVTHKIKNTFEEAKNFIESLPKLSHSYANKSLGLPSGNLYAKIRTKGKDYWQTEEPSGNITMTHTHIYNNMPLWEREVIIGNV